MMRVLYLECQRASAHPVLLTGVVEPFLRSGMSALLGLLALPSNGLPGAPPLPPDFLAWPPPSSLMSFSAVLVWLLLGPVEGMDGPAGEREGEEEREANGTSKSKECR